MLETIFDKLTEEKEIKLISLCSVIGNIPPGKILKYVKSNRKHAMTIVNYCFSRNHIIIKPIIKILSIEELRKCISTINSFKETDDEWKTNRIDIIAKEISTREK
jgi:hypothetical protein